EAGSPLTYGLVVHNAGPDTATGVSLSDPLPAGVTFVSAQASQGSCGGTTTVTCDLGTLAAGAEATVALVVTPTGAGPLTNTATVTAGRADPDSGNNQASALTTVNPAPSSADVSVTQSDAPAPVEAGSPLTYGLVVHNAGP